MNEYDSEPIPGLPELLPAGESMLMQVRPDWCSFAIHVFHARKIAFYCALLIVWRVVAAYTTGIGLGAALLDGAAVLPLAAAGVLIPVGLAWAYARTSIYTITDRRVVMRIGVALPMTFNLPYRQIEAAELRLYPDGTGDLPLRLSGDVRLAYLHLWPHVRPWRVQRPEPMLRAVPEAQRVADALAAEMRKVDATTPATPEAEMRREAACLGPPLAAG